MKIFSGMRGKILLLLLITGLLPLVVTSALFYSQAREIIVKDRVETYLKHLSQQNVDKLDLFITERQDDCLSMSLEKIFGDFLAKPDPHLSVDVIQTLNEFSRIHVVYDLLILVDNKGTILATNSVNRFDEWFDFRILSTIVGSNISLYPEESIAWEQARERGTTVHDWYRSSLVHKMYLYEDDDASRSFHVVFGRSILDNKTGATVGVLLAVMNWEFIQANLDLVEKDFQKFGLPSGYALLLDRQNHRIMAAPFRKNRSIGNRIESRNIIGADLSSAKELGELQKAIQTGGETIRFHLNGLRQGAISPLGHHQLSWKVMISLSEADIFRPVYRLGYFFAGIIAVAVLLIAAGAWILSHSLIRPLQILKETALDIAHGEYTGQVPVSSEDEIGILAQTFNRMSQTIEERRRELEEANLVLEEKVKERTRALEESNIELRQAIQSLEETQDHLVQSEKMASLGRLIAGIAHEIKNPLNFIYGNTRFLEEYIDKLRAYTAFMESQPAGSTSTAQVLQDYRHRENIDFVMDDLKNLSSNIHEGAKRIRSIVDDLRTFSRAPSGSKSEVDLRKVLDMCLNLLRNQYKNRIRIHRDYAEIPLVLVDLGKMEQVFLNLITNAIEAIEGEGDIWISIKAKNDILSVEIRDSGKGIATGILKRIFEPFFTTKPVGQGTGLGLSISYSIIEQHGGRISTSNHPKGGACFRVELPALSTDNQVNPSIQNQTRT